MYLALEISDRQHKPELCKGVSLSVLDNFFLVKYQQMGVPCQPSLYLGMSVQAMVHIAVLQEEAGVACYGARWLLISQVALCVDLR